MNKSRHLALSLLLLPALSQHANAEGMTVGEPTSGATTIDAQRLEIRMDRELHAIGDAELHQDDQAIFGDRIDYDMLTHKIHAVGNARIEQDGNVISGPELELQMDESVGEMKQPVFTLKMEPKQQEISWQRRAVTLAQKSKPAESARGDASTLLFEGQNKKTLKDARYTTCEAGNDDWYMKAKEFEIDRYTETGTATHASIEFKGVPILYTPWIDFPLNNQRMSGFLTPTFGTTSRSGLEFMLPYYWNISPNMDATLSPRYLSRRGTEVDGEFRYLEADYSGVDTIQYLPDDNISNKDRYFAWLKHQHDFGNGFTGGFDIQRVSDGKFFADLSTHIVSTSLVNMPQQAYINYNSDTWNFNALAQQFQTLDTSNPRNYPYQRLPQLTLTRSDSWNVANTDFYSQWVRFERSDHAPGAVTGNRLTLHPSVSMPFVEPYAYFTPRVGAHITRYSLNDNSNNLSDKTLTVPVLSLDTGMYFDREFRVVSNRYQQTLEPRIFYVYAPYRKQSNLPNFDTGLADINLSTIFSENQFSGNDRFNDANQLTLAVTSRFIDNKTGEQRLSATLGQRFYFGEQKVTACVIGENSDDPKCRKLLRTGSASDMLAAFSAHLRTHWDVDGTFQYNTDQGEFFKRNISTRYSPENGKVFNIAYRFTRDYLEQFDTSAQWPLAPRWYGLGQLSYSLKENDRHPIQALGGIEYDAGCWQGRAVVQRISPATTSNPNYAFYFQLVLGGLSSIGTDPLDILKRNIPGYVNSSWIPEANY